MPSPCSQPNDRTPQAAERFNQGSQSPTHRPVDARRYIECGILILGERAYPPVSCADTLVRGPNGGAVAEHDAGAVKLFSDTEVCVVRACWREWKSACSPTAEKMVLGQETQGAFALVTRDGPIPVWIGRQNNTVRHLVPQQAHRSCMYASAAMILLDLCSAQHISQLASDDVLRSVATGNLGSPESLGSMIDSALAETQYRSRITILPELDADLLRNLLVEHGSGILSIGGEIGGHALVVDPCGADSSKFRVRDPFHGWDIEVHARSLLNRVQGLKTDLIQIVDTGIKRQPLPSNPAIMTRLLSMFRRG